MKNNCAQLSAIKQLAAEHFQYSCRKYPNTPQSFIPKWKGSDTNSNGLTKCILTKIRIDGFQCERISNQGRVIDGRKRVTDVLGRTGTIGTITRIKSSGTNGTADISATIKGRSVKIEVKIKKDFQSTDQVRYQAEIESAGGIYIVATSYANFLEQYNQLIK